MKVAAVFASRLRAARRATELTQAEFAVRAGFQPTAVCRFEAGKVLPSFENLLRLAKALEVSVAYLVGEESKRLNLYRVSYGFHQPREREAYLVAAKTETQAADLTRGDGSWVEVEVEAVDLHGKACVIQATKQGAKA